MTPHCRYGSELALKAPHACPPLGSTLHACRHSDDGLVSSLRQCCLAKLRRGHPATGAPAKLTTADLPSPTGLAMGAATRDGVYARNSISCVSLLCWPYDLSVRSTRATRQGLHLQYTKWRKTRARI